MLDINEIVCENNRRRSAATAPYNPSSGEGCFGQRVTVCLPDAAIAVQHIPLQMLEDNPWIAKLVETGSITAFMTRYFDDIALSKDIDNFWEQWLKYRIRYDFEFWAAMYVTIKDKLSSADIPFILNRPQRRLLAAFEKMRNAGKPIRLIMLKARQWGGSTLIQIYMAWIQLVHRRNWNSLICAHLKDASAQIKGMYTKILDNYPSWLLDSREPLRFQPFERSNSTSYIPHTGCKVTIGSAESPEAIRGSDIVMAHLSEAAFWNDTPAHTPESLIRAVCGAIAMLPLSVVAIESTANGTGGYFHREYFRACRGESDKQPFFVPWYEIEIYARPVEQPEAFAATLTSYEQTLWQKGATLEAIAWYRDKRREYAEHADMMAEYPSDDIEAFSYSGERVFDLKAVQRLRQDCVPPRWTGDIKGDAPTGRQALQNIGFVAESGGLLRIWDMPCAAAGIRYPYIVTVDIGGRSSKADYSVIAVFDRRQMPQGGIPCVVAQWRGHTDHDLLAWKAAQIAAFYNNALLVVESNTLETACCEEQQAGYILDIIADNYRNLYARRHEGGEITDRTPVRWGFHMNRSTKQKLINHQINVLRERAYIERDELACYEYDVYERKPNGSYGAKDGHHDDILITRCLGTFVCQTEPTNLVAATFRGSRTPINEASF